MEWLEFLAYIIVLFFRYSHTYKLIFSRNYGIKSIILPRLYKMHNTWQDMIEKALYTAQE